MPEPELDKHTFGQQVLAMDILQEANEVEQNAAHRASRLYRFDKPKYRKPARKGFNFEV